MFDKTKKLPIACDHGAFEMKEFLKEQLVAHGYQVEDMGTYSDASVDYPDMIHPLAKAINDGVYGMGIILCGSGNGAQITANKYLKVRAGLCWTVEQAQLTRMHNDANIMSIPGRFVEKDLAWKMLQAFLNTDFEGGRHIGRVEKISQLL
ncbi:MULTISPECIES: RpiB/LacA/LacB family sugar-phosphate isomerase [unclassified Lentimicrobium]|uniref:RpiB/LacA/LacB family sugar-phosphate isomerase n=1 Tax=unclassified Lentimicrobium TaxID=2677434 RepID=UPI001552D928|nr:MULTISPECIES: RpiB/LacA/LacB family sugar-phosphate isomerase [unclassified Lentimicrobium]NPD47440.1 RpiB/LacA/LacB family sugar-phosphate isomerase [Lentimicrobium sp. S6]NPD86338.1 RpiB/LacA/LacB family sugar-phosphate isomerase [Lentimicrobium sp. L6]